MLLKWSERDSLLSQTPHKTSKEEPLGMLVGDVLYRPHALPVTQSTAYKKTGGITADHKKEFL